MAIWALAGSQGHFMHRWRHQMNRILRWVVNRDSRLRREPGWRVSFGLSTMIHATAMGLLALVVVAPARNSDVATVLAEWVDAAPETSVQIDAPVDTQLTGASSPGGRAGSAGLLAAGVEMARQHAEPERTIPFSATGAVAPLELDERLPPARDLAQSTLGVKLGKGFALGGGFGSGFGNGEGNGVGSQFFE